MVPHQNRPKLSVLPSLNLTDFGRFISRFKTCSFLFTILKKAKYLSKAQSITSFSEVKEIEHIHFSEKDVVRHPLVTKIVKSYNESKQPR